MCHNLNQQVPTKSMGDIVRYFYKWKKTDRYEPIYSEWTKIYKPNKKFRKHGLAAENSTETPVIEEEASDSEDSEDESDSDPTIVPNRGAPREGYQCMNCGTMESHIWRRSPGDTDKKRKSPRKVLCDDCGVFWLKYGIARVQAKPRGSGNESEETGEIRIAVPADAVRRVLVPGAIPDAEDVLGVWIVCTYGYGVTHYYYS
ncbi:hypothetical protein BC937DRAFT_92239 [Endogone sp. FLAS-F59071]|nr:hypothetical protein BC937DRAFT_92239 [Endogone sp. FLAS-F59071]|eukprot:RUS15605.1 hypothetical protein BC937DRAFT_92239 [Endogone sp. FLAS-F59071]